MSCSTAFPVGCDVLLLDDDAALRKRLAGHLRAAGNNIKETGRLEDARRLLRESRFDFAVIDLHLPDGEGVELLREGAFAATTGVVVMTAFGDVTKAVEAMRLGAADYLAKPFDPQELALAFDRCGTTGKSKRREQHATREHESDQLFFGQSLHAVRKQLDMILAAERRLGERLPPLLIEGETGTGKSALARWVHAQGQRQDQPFVAVNCATFPDTLVDAELFGYERGAFTDAKQSRLGLFEAADGGTLFLDEISALTSAAQAKVLTAVEEGKIRRLGGAREIPVDVRLVAASNRPLATLVEQKIFREDLYHRLNLLRIVLPPLRERGTEIVALARHLLARIAKRHRISTPEITRDGEARLLGQTWSGNIRELAHELERTVIFSDGTPLDFAHLGSAAQREPASGSWRNPAWRLPEAGFSLDRVIADLIAEALRETNGNVSAAARRLGVTREFLRYHLAEAKSPSGESSADATSRA